jgi:hypothetical protein
MLLLALSGRERKGVWWDSHVWCKFTSPRFTGELPQVRQEFLHGCPCKELASRYGLSARTVFRWTFEKSRGARPRKLGRALGIDEYSRRKGHRYNTIVVDLDKGRPITTFKGRRGDDVVKWFKSRPQAERARVEVVVLYVEVVLFGHPRGLW